MLGSFAVATTWRLRASQLEADRMHGYKPSTSERKEYNFIRRLIENKRAKERSNCLHCHRQLKAVDLVPVFSWLIFRGKCRTCKNPIGYSEILAEIGLAAALVVSYISWPVELDSLHAWISFAVWIVLLLLLAIHIVYDAKWLLLLDKITIMITVFAVVFIGLKIITTNVEMPGCDG